MLGIFAAAAENLGDVHGAHVAAAAMPIDPVPPGWLAVAVARALDTLTDSLAGWCIWFALVSIIVFVFGVWSAVAYPVISTRFGRRVRDRLHKKDNKL